MWLCAFVVISDSIRHEFEGDKRRLGGRFTVKHTGQELGGQLCEVFKL